MSAAPPVWHVLQFSSAIDFEFASALASLVPVILWEPDRTVLPWRPAFRDGHESRQGSQLRIQRFPLLRGFHRFPISLLARTGAVVTSWLAKSCAQPDQSPLICTTPYFSPVAEAWPAPVIYWLTDRIADYEGANPVVVQRLDRRMCQAATLVCPNSERLARYLIEEAGCEPKKIKVVPNGVRAASLLPEPACEPSPLPAELEHLPRPVAGVIGNLAGNTNWLMLERLVELVPSVSWAFVGPTTMPIADSDQNRARHAVMQHPRTCFVGEKPHTELARFARALDVAVLPYLLREPTFSGSSTRYYEHLAACRPMIAFPGVDELRSKRPLLQLAESVEEAVSALDQLRSKGFDDGLAEERWRVSRRETWGVRATTVRDALERMQHASSIAEPKSLSG